MNNYKIVLLIAVITFAIGCQKDPLIHDNKVIEGVETSLRLTLTPPKMDVVTRSVLDDAKEKEVISLAFFVFDKTGFIVSSAIHDNVTAHVTGGTLGIDAGASMNIPTTSGPGRQLYAIANYDANQIDNLKSVTTLDDLKQLVANLYANPIFREFGLIKVGSTNADIPPSGVDVPIVLHYISAKITIKVVNKSPDLIVNSWNIGNIPLKTYLLERPYSATNTNSNDAVDQTNEADFYNDFASISLPFDVSDPTPGVGTPTGKEYKAEFYLTENRQGVLPLSARKPLEPPYTGLAPTDYKVKSWDAPKTATYITILGQKSPGANPQAMFIKHYLGENSYDNYNIKRGVHYTYTITINNLNEIDIDTNVEQYDDPIPIEVGADLTSIDAHASFRVFVLHTETGASQVGGKVTAELANFANSTDYPSWLKISLSPLHFSQVRVSQSETAISRWQQTGADWSYVRTKFIPHSSKRQANYLAVSKPYNAFSFFGDIGTPPTLNDADNPDYIVGKDAYPAYDNELPFSWAARRMVSKITDIPAGETGDYPTKIYLYADEFLPDGRDERSAVLRIIYEMGDKKTTHVFRIVQKAPIQFMGLPGENSIMLVEAGEEYAHLLQNELGFDLQLLAGMQWGNYQGIATSQSDGELNTLQGVYGTVTSKSNYSANSFLKKYGSLAGKWSAVNDGEIPEGSPISPLVGDPIASFYAYTSGGQQATNYYNSTYNSTAARYCHEKNWDENGNGQIDPDEAKWYLPSQQELQLFWTYREKLNVAKDYYWSSTSATADEAFAVSMLESAPDPKYTYDGVQQPLSKITVVAKNRPRVRCVRRIPTATANVKRYAPMIIYENKSLLIDCSNLTSDMFTTQSKYGISQNDIGSILKANSKVFKKLLVQLEQPAAVTYSPLHLDVGKCDESKGWRLPTQREMLLIWSVKDLIAAETGSTTNFAPFINGNYWTMTRSVSKQYIVDFNTGLAKHEDHSLTGSAALNYRCVKEVR